MGTSTGKPPRWVAAFLRALERTGEVEAAARDAAIDKSTAYYRRKAHREFADAWDVALRAHQAARAAAEREEIAAVRAGRLAIDVDPPHPDPLPAGEREACGEMAISGGQMRRVNGARWNKAAERRFFAALADTANVQAAADAAGFSTTAVYARRLRKPVFREQWAAAVDTARARLDLVLLETANRALEAGIAGVPERAPSVTVAEALQILKIGAQERPPVGHDGRRRLNAGARANVRVASSEEIAEALAKRLAVFGKRMERETAERERREREAKDRGPE